MNDLIDHHSLDYKYEEEDEAQAAQHDTSVPGCDSFQKHNMSIQEQNLRLDEKLQDDVNIHVKDLSWEIDLQKKIVL